MAVSDGQVSGDVAKGLHYILGIKQRPPTWLYATKRQAFTKILLPLMMPGIISGVLLAFIISLDDFIITNFVKGAGVETLPTAIFGAVKQGIKPNIMAISTMLLAFSIVMVTLSYFISKTDEAQ